jgi:hypothetical protein
MRVIVELLLSNFLVFKLANPVLLLWTITLNTIYCSLFYSLYIMSKFLYKTPNKYASMHKKIFRLIISIFQIFRESKNTIFLHLQFTNVIVGIIVSFPSIIIHLFSNLYMICQRSSNETVIMPLNEVLTF